MAEESVDELIQQLETLCVQEDTLLRQIIQARARESQQGQGTNGADREADNFRMNTRSGRYGATYSMVGLPCFNEELSLLPKNPTEAKLQATSTRGESTEPT
jgi:hypothetical protein